MPRRHGDKHDWGRWDLSEYQSSVRYSQGRSGSITLNASKKPLQQQKLLRRALSKSSQRDREHLSPDDIHAKTINNSVISSGGIKNKRLDPENMSSNMESGA